MNSVIKLYKTKITPAKNFLVEKIEDYLSTCLIYQYSNFQYIKHALAITIKLNINQNNYSSFSPNYVSIKNNDSVKIYYYFVVAIKWLAVDTLALELNLDTINTFQEIEFSNKTQITREITTRTFYNESARAYRKIDDMIEGIDLPKEVILDKKFNTGKDRLKWYLMTQSSADLNEQDESGVNPTRTILIPEEPIKINNAGTTTDAVEIRADEFTGGARYIYFTAYDNVGGTIDNYIYNMGAVISGYEVKLLKIEIVEDSAGLPQFKMEAIGYNGVAYNSWTSYHYTIKFNKMNFGILSNANLYSASDYNKLINQYRSPKLYIQAGLSTNLYSMGINDVDRTDSRIVKIVEMPYSPMPFNILSSNGVYSVANTEYKYGVFYINNIGDKEFENALENKLDLRDYLNVDVPLINEVDEYNNYIAVNQRIYETQESKLYSSEFFEVKLVYDSFFYNIELERFTYLYDETTFNSLFNIYFKMNKNVKSIMAFRWKDIDLASEYKSDEDYPFYLICNRNNELTIYNSNYINYLKTGYNFDKKQKEKEIAVGTAGVVAQVVGAVASFASTPFTGGVGVATGIALASSTAVSIASQIASISQNEEARKNKRNELRLQGVNVLNADDTDILSFYKGDKLKLVIRALKNRYKDMLLKLFHFCGYASNRIGVPFYKTNPQRILFDYVQCNAIFKNVGGYQSEYIDDLTLRMSAGLTILHAYKLKPNSTSYSWSFEQDRANLDSYLLNDTEI